MCGGALCKDICVEFTHDNKHSIANHYEPLVKQQLGNPKMKPNEVKIKIGEETSNQKQQKYQQSIPEDASNVYVVHQQDRLLLSQLRLTFPSSMDGARSRNRSKLPRPSELDNRTPPTTMNRAQFGA